MEIFDGKIHAKELDAQISDFVLKHSKLPSLAIIQVGDNGASTKYVELKAKLCKKFNIPVNVYEINENITNTKIYETIKSIIFNQKINGVIIQLPLPRQSLYPVLDYIPEEKDVDMLSGSRMAKFMSDDKSFKSPIIRAFEYFLNSNRIQVYDKKCDVIGYGMLVGKPISNYLLSHKAKVCVLDKAVLNNNIKGLTFLNHYKEDQKINADVLVLSSGVVNMIKGENVSKGCHIVDFGSSVLNGRSVGDFDTSSVKEHLGILSLVPGGVGPLVVRFLVMNLLGI